MRSAQKRSKINYLANKLLQLTLDSFLISAVAPVGRFQAQLSKTLCDDAGAMKPIPRIDNGKLPRAPLKIVQIPVLPSETPYGNLLLKSMNIVKRLDRVNLEIGRVYNTYIHPSAGALPNTDQGLLGACRT